MVCLNETFLDSSVSDDAVTLGGYVLAARRDRHDGRVGGGILCFMVREVSAQVTLSEHSTEFERSWSTIHSELGPILCGIWYRPPVNREVASINACEQECLRLSTEHVGTILVGDLNVHHTRWLRFSDRVSVEGTSLLRFCSANGLKQLVKRPTRENHLLDLVISDLQALAVEILHAISDHHMVLASFDIGIPESTVVMRTVFDYMEADWASIKHDIAVFDWTFIDTASVDEAEQYLHDSRVRILRLHIPERSLCGRTSLHPWVNERCLLPIQRNNFTAGIDEFGPASAECSRILFHEYLLYIEHMMDTLRKEKRGSKSWWRVANEIMEKQTKTAAIPALKGRDAVWVREPGAKRTCWPTRSQAN